jgi:phage regulator Rha-like protein
VLESILRASIETDYGGDMVDASIVPAELIEKRIFVFRGKKVMLSVHLADLYGVSAKALVQAVKRNRQRFPEDFMFQLNWEESRFLRSQTVTLEKVPAESLDNRGKHGKFAPYAFTEQGVAMLSSVLRSERAIQMNITIMRAFARLREFLASHRELSDKLHELESRLEQHDDEIRAIFEAIRQLMEPEKEEGAGRIGY